MPTTVCSEGCMRWLRRPECGSPWIWYYYVDVNDKIVHVEEHLPDLRAVVLEFLVEDFACDGMQERRSRTRVRT